MAQIITGGLVSDLRGSIGGLTFQRSASGLTVKAKTSPVQPTSAARSKSRSQLATLQNSWQNLTVTERQNWSTWAQYQNIRNRSFGGAVLSGQQAFMQMNRYRLLTEQTVVTTPVFTPYTLPILTLSLTSSAGVFLAAFLDMTDSSAYFPVLLMSGPIRAARNARPSNLRYVGTDEAIDDQHWDISDHYAAAFGQVPPSGSRVFVTYMIQQVSNGALSPQLSQAIDITT
jgi:hypothetical protein